jgi:tRNA wybutosine-synthesizing protein 1
MSLPEELLKSYIKQKYRIVGAHSAVKTCMWVSKSLNTSGREHCYKQKFYGIPTHRCMQMTPGLGHCTQTCVFCWRATPENIGVGWDQASPIMDSDDPDEIIDGCIKYHQKLIYGFGGNNNVAPEFLKEALNPIHAAISLEGEPTLYPRLGELVSAFKKRGFKSVFIVTNGTNPEVLQNLGEEPSQLYISVCAPDEETYMKTCRPISSGSWSKLQDSLELLQSFNCPTVLRYTLVPKLNMHNPEGYARLVAKSNPTYQEPKAAMSVGYARQRFGYTEMAHHKDIQTFAMRLSEETGYRIIDEQWQSSIVLLSRLDKAIKLY